MDNQKLKEFEQLIEKYRSISGKSHINGLTDFLEYGMSFFSLSIRTEEGRFNKRELEVLAELLEHWILTQNYMLHEGGREWYDLFGSFYETYSSKWTLKDRGQFFTPPAIVDLTTGLIGSKEAKNQSISDPTCGSGRMLIASHAYNPKNYHFGEDIDKTCCLMTVLNMAIHGCIGEVVWHNSLEPTSYFGGWRINENIRNSTLIPLINIREITKEQSTIYMNAERIQQENEKRRTQKQKEERLRVMPFDLFSDEHFNK